MKCVDVNVLLYSAFDTAPQHDLALRTLSDLAAGPEPLGLPSIVLSGFLRIATSRRVFTRPLAPEQAWDFVSALMAWPATAVIDPGPRHWATFAALCSDHAPRGNDVADVYLAALAIEANADWVSFDRGFARFDGLRWVLPRD